MSVLLGLFLALAWPSSFGEAQKRYDSGDYRAAAGLFQDLVAKNPSDPILRYNLGNAHFKSGALGPAIASYQRAFDRLPRDPDIRHNLEFALNKAGEQLVPSGIPPILFRLFWWFSKRELAGLHWIAAWLALLLGGLSLYRRDLRPRLGRPAAACLAFWAIFGLWWLARRNLDPRPMGVIVRPTAELRSGPGERFSVSFTAPEGRRAQILSQEGDWLEIGLIQEGVKGWIAASSIEPI
ncbi:MAG: tetratricopeptide repeat protein [Elusimicrobia bacterium]|nr:tetratricopeptide repeat protein [Elusimicrobiota bacterium]